MSALSPINRESELRTDAAKLAQLWKSAHIIHMVDNRLSAADDSLTFIDADGVAAADGAGESVIADGDDRAGAVERAGTAAARGDRAIEGQSGDGIRSLHDQGAAGETRITRIAPTGDGDGTRARAQLGRIGDDERASLDVDSAFQRVGVVGQHQRAVTRLGQASAAGELRVDRHARTEVDAQRGGIDADRRGERQTRARQLVIIARGERDTGKDQPADRDVFAERDLSSRAREIGDIIGRGREIAGRSRARDRSAGTSIDPSGATGVQPGAETAGADRRIIGVPEDVRGLGGLGRTDGEERRSDHQRGARKQGTRLRTFH